MSISRYVLLLLVAALPLVNSDVTGSSPSVNSCLCIDDDSTQLNSFVCGKPIRSRQSGRCYSFSGQKKSCRRGRSAVEIFLLLEGDTGRYSGWFRGDQLMSADQERCETRLTPQVSDTDDCPHIVSRAEWGARPPLSVENITEPIPRVFVHHTAGNSCSTETQCSSTVRGIQNFHMDTRGWDDIGYNFLIGEDGNVYEGRGWDRVGAQVRGYNTVSLGFSVMGTYDERVPNDAALKALQALIACGVAKGKLATDYALHGHRDGGHTTCPGQKLYELIQTWPHYAGPLPIPPLVQQVVDGQHLQQPMGLK